MFIPNLNRHFNNQLSWLKVINFTFYVYTIITLIYRIFYASIINRQNIFNPQVMERESGLAPSGKSIQFQGLLLAGKGNDHLTQVLSWKLCHLMS